MIKGCGVFHRSVGDFSNRLGHLSREGIKPSPTPGKCDPCMNVYVMIPPSSSGASAGKGFMPFQK